MARVDSRSQAGRALSQHSLRNQDVAARIVVHSGLAPPDVVYEVGAGSGVLTAEIARHVRRVVAIEQHREAWAALRCRFASEPRVSVVLGDFLRYPLPRRGDYKVVGNPPFAITSALIRRLLSLSNPPVQTLLVVQREAGLRWSGEIEESVVSLVAKVRFEFDIRLALRRQDFHPHPRVACVLLRIRRRRQPLLSPADEREFEAFLRHRFGHRGSPTHRNGHDVPQAVCFDEWIERFRTARPAGPRRRVVTPSLR